VPAPDPRPGLWDSGRRALDALIDLARVRLELFGTELEAEKLRLFDALVRLAIGVVLLGLALVLALGFVLLLLWESHRLAAIGVLALAFAAAGAAFLRRAREGLTVRDGEPFALTLGELRRDRAGLADDTAPPPPDRPGA
jgi:uncharacterized membrane protein YqjE